MGADADDQRRPLLVAISIATSSLVPAAGTTWCVEAGLEQPLAAGRAAVGIGVDDQLGAAGAAPRRRPSPCRRGSRPASAPLRARRRRRRRRRRSAAARRGCRRAAPSGRGGGGRRGRRSGRGGRGSEARVGGKSMLPVSRSVSSRTWATVFSANSASASSIRSRCSCISRSSSATREDAAARRPPRRRRGRRRRRSARRSPSLSSSKSPASGASIRRIPSRASISGPAFG